MSVVCAICGGQTFAATRVLWASLIAEWELAPHEVDYVDRQQGECCTSCGGSLRHTALGNAIRSASGDTRTIKEMVAAQVPASILDVNGAEVISTTLAGLPNYTRANYPDVDLQNLPYDDNSFDLVIHSDTLEHVPNPLVALEHCRRVLKPGGWLCFTVPLIVERLTRSRALLPPSYHGDPAVGAEDYVVHTEFGADAWTFLARAGFTDIRIQTVSYPAAQALMGRKTG